MTKIKSVPYAAKESQKSKKSYREDRRLRGSSEPISPFIKHKMNADLHREKTGGERRKSFSAAVQHFTTHQKSK